MSNYFYTAIVQPSTGKIQYAEHFESEVERNKRARQLESEARRISPPADAKGKPHADAWLCYSGEEPPEAFFARIDQPVRENESQENYQKRVDGYAAEASKKTRSVLTEPEIDDSQESRQLPAWAIAQSEMEKAAQLLVDVKQGAEILQKRADRLAEECYSRSSDDNPRGPNELKEARRKAVDAQAEADHEAARLYHAEQDYLQKAENFKALFNAAHGENEAKAK